MFASGKTSAASTGGYQISRSLRFNSADSAYLNRTPASTTNRQIWTWSGWVKRGKLGVNGRVFQAREGSTGNQFFLRFSSDNTIYITGSSGAFELQTTQVFRDPSAWYHIVFACDTTQATSSNRFKLYVNGSQVTAFGTATYPSQNLNTTVNSAFPHGLGAETSGPSEFFDGYITETYLIDGQALTPSSFGETNAQTGVWQPKAYSGSYGTNGFYLNFSDNSNTTAATLGKDYSGNGNNWTPNNFSVTAGAGNDSLVDSPTSYGTTDTGVGGEIRGNYCTLNPLATGSGKVLVNGNLEFTSSTSNWYFSLGTIGFSSGKYYWEVNMGSTNGSDMFAGIMGSGIPVNGANGLQDNVTALNTYGSLLFCDDGKYQLDGNTGRVAYSTALGSNQTLGIAVDMDAKSLTFYKDGVSQGAISFSSSPMASSFVSPSFSSYATSDSARVFNFGQRPFAYTAPSGFKALCTQNLPTPTIGATTATQANKFFNPVLYTGTGSDNRAVTGVGFQPDFVWVKGRDIGQSHALNNAVMGVGTLKTLYSNLTASQGTYDDYGYLQSLDSDGYTIKNGSINGNIVNASGYQYVAWNWKASNATAVTNTSGTITSSVSANTTSGFSILTYTGNGTNTSTIGHGLGTTPSMIIVKNRSSSCDWIVYHVSLGGTNNLFLNGTYQAGSPSNGAIYAPSNTIFTTYDTGSAIQSNQAGQTYVAYCFAEVAGYSKFGSYTGNGSTDGPFVFTGFRPAYVMVKRTDTTGDWRVWDTTRETYNVMSAPLYPNDSGAEASSSVNNFDVLSNGFKVRNATAAINANGGAYIFMAFASNPFKYSLAR